MAIIGKNGKGEVVFAANVHRKPDTNGLCRRREARVLWFDRAAFVAAHLIPAALLVWVVGKLFL